MQHEHVEIVPYSAARREDFGRLNIEWLERHFTVEPIDQQVLSDPEAAILAPGGSILFALLDGVAVGCVALLPDPDRPGAFELTKMAVTARCQGRGIGGRLLEAAIAEFRRLDGRELFLESNSVLDTALRLYTRLGFERQPGRKPGSHYARSDVYMIWRDPSDAPAALEAGPGA